MRTLLPLCLLAFAVRVNADMTVKDYRARMAVKESTTATVAKVYIQGIGDGFTWANAILQKNGKTPLYCQPVKLGLGKDNYVAMIDEQIKALSAGVPEAQLNEFDVGLLLLDALREDFPCTTDK